MKKLLVASCAVVVVTSVLAAAPASADRSVTTVGTMGTGAVADGPARESEAVARGLIVKARAGTPDATIERAVQRAADTEVAADVEAGTPSTLTGRVDTVDFDRLVPADEAADAAALVAARPDVEWAVPNRRVQAQKKAPVSTNDHYFTRQYQLWDSRSRRQSNGTQTPSGGYSVKAPALWRATKGAPSVQVAVLDTGVRPEHPDLRNQLVPGYDMVDLDLDGAGQPMPGVPTTYTANDGNGRDADPSDPGDWIPKGDRLCYGERTRSLEPSSWHGTHVTGTIAAQANNKVGVSGIAPGVKVQPVRVLGRCGGYDSDIVAGIVWAAGGAVPGVPTNPRPSQVINLSLGGYLPTAAQAQEACPAYTHAIADAKAKGSLTVIAAGNELGDVARSVPAACGSDALVVGATSEDGYRAFYSNRGSRVDLMAPGGDFVMAEHGVMSTVNLGTTTPGRNSYASKGWMGTSMATPAVSAGAALLLSLGVRPADLKTALKESVAGFAPVRSRYDQVRLRDGSGRVSNAGNLNCRSTRSACGTGILDLSKVPAPTSTPTIAGQPMVGGTLTANSSWNGAPSGLTYQWSRDGVDLDGATQRSYTVRPEDAGSRLAVRISPTDRFYASVVARSLPTLPVGTRVSLSAPTRATYGRGGSVEVTSTGDGAPTSGRVELRRGSTLLGSATMVDGTARVAVSGTSWVAGRNDLHAVLLDGTGATRSGTSTVTVAKARPSAVRTSMKTSIKRSTRLRVAVRVVVPGVARPTGRVQVRDGRRTVKGATLSSSRSGRVTLTLPTLRRGTHVLRVRYLGSSTTSARWSTTTRVRVR